MECAFCKGRLVEMDKTFLTEIGGIVIVVRNVPSLVCEQCGEISYTDETYAKLEAIITKLRNSVTEVAITDFTQYAA